MSVLRLALDVHDPLQRQRLERMFRERPSGTPGAAAGRAGSGARLLGGEACPRPGRSGDAREVGPHAHVARARGVRAPRCGASPPARRHEGARDAPRGLGLVGGRAAPVPRRDRQAAGAAPRRTLVRLHPAAWPRAVSHEAAQVGDVPAPRLARRSPRRVHRTGTATSSSRGASASRRRPTGASTGGPTRARSRWCSAASAAARSSCRCGCPPRRATSPSSTTTSPTPDRWHKVDLVRTRAPHAPGGWRYEAHLMVLTAPYVSPSARARRAEVAVAEADRVAGIDVNVSNLTIASQVAGRRPAAHPRRARRAERRSEIAAADAASDAASARWSGRGVRFNRAQYQLSKRQEKRARRRAARGLASRRGHPAGPARGTGRWRAAPGLPPRSSSRAATAVSAPSRSPTAAAAAQARRDQARRVGRRRRRRPRVPARRRGRRHLRLGAQVGTRSGGVHAGLLWSRPSTARHAPSPASPALRAA